jgi:hypothetical protein
MRRRSLFGGLLAFIFPWRKQLIEPPPPPIKIPNDYYERLSITIGRSTYTSDGNGGWMRCSWLAWAQDVIDKGEAVPAGTKAELHTIVRHTPWQADPNARPIRNMLLTSRTFDA